MKVRIIGDVHGKFGPYRELIRDVPRSIQVGDMGVGFYRVLGDELKPSKNPPFDAMSQGDHRFIRGNHDNPEVCKRHKFWIPDGSVRDGIFFLGGATSIDKEWRTPGIDWWEEEQLSIPELERAIDVYAAVKPDVVITHECPESIANAILAAFNRVKIFDGSRTRQALQAMFSLHQPRLWVFGHWHHSLTFDHPIIMPGGKSTRFICLDELEYMDAEL